MKYVATPEETEDLFEIIVKVEIDGVKARTQRYPVKRTKQNFLPLHVTDEQEAEGYSYRMDGRVPVDNLLKVMRLSFGDGPNHIWRHIYCLKDQQETALAMVRADIDKTARRFLADATGLNNTWFNRPFVMDEKKKKHDSPTSEKVVDYSDDRQSG